MSGGGAGAGGRPPFGPLGVMRSWLRAGRDGSSQQRGTGASPLVWLIFIAGVLYFFLPLVGSFLASLRIQWIRDRREFVVPPDPLLAYQQVLADDRFYTGLLYSFTIGAITIIVSLLLIIPTAYWVRLKVPRLRPLIEFVTLLPFVVPPVVLVFGLVRVYGSPLLPLLSTNTGSDVVLVCAYVVLSFPYMYRAVDTGLAAIDVRSLTEASQSLGAGWARLLWQVIFPNLRAAILSGAFLTLAIVMGEYVIAQFLARQQAFGPYLSLLGRSAPYTPAVVSLISFILTWVAMGVIAYIGRGARQRVQVAGAR